LPSSADTTTVTGLDQGVSAAVGTGLGITAVAGIVIDVGTKVIAVGGIGVATGAGASMRDNHGTVAAKQTNTKPMPKSHNKPLIFAPAPVIRITSPCVNYVTSYGIFGLITSI
jgi:hypothetical protein